VRAGCPICGASAHHRSTTSASVLMYMSARLVMLLRGFSDAIMMRTQQAIAVGSAQGYLPPTITTRSSRRTHDHDLFRGDALVIGLMNFVVPLQLGCATSPFRC